MTSPGALTDSRSGGPLYFFDQPTKRNRIKDRRCATLCFSVAKEERQLEVKTQREDELTGEACAESKPDTPSAAGAAPSIRNHDPVDAYKRTAPKLLRELARLLSEHKWTEKGCIPHGIVNILNYSRLDLTAGARMNSPERTDRRRESKGPPKLDEARSRQVSANEKREAAERNSRVVENVAPPARKPQMSSNACVKKRKAKCNRAAHKSSTISFSVSSGSCKNTGWIIQLKPPSCDEPQWISLCQWVVARLQAARNPENLQTAEQDQYKPLILRHYGDAKAKLKDRRERRKAKPAVLVNGMPRIPEVKQWDPAQHKLHYRINDGSSCIYYPSGRMVVCQSHSGLLCGGFYTNVFSDSECPVILATITASGHGAFTHPHTSAMTVWDQDGGFMCDDYGNISKEWSWQAGRTPREKIVIQMSDLISLRLLSGTYAMLSFRWNSESVHLPLSALNNMNQSKDTTEVKCTSDAAQDPLLAKRTKSPTVLLESKRSLMLTPVSACSREVLQMAREVEGLEEPSAPWRRGRYVGRELKRLQQRARNALDDWLEYYRVAIGIKCPDMERMPDAPLRTRLRRELHSAALPSLNPPERADAKPVQPVEGRNELQETHQHLFTPAQRPPESKLSRKPKRQPKKEPRVTQIGPLQIYGNIKLESIILAGSPDLQPCDVSRRPAPPLFSPSVPLTVCPALLRAALLGEGGRRRCCCSATRMPAVTDLEYDAFVLGQPPHSQQILVVCVTVPHQPVNLSHAAPEQDALEQLYRRRNKHRTMPCTQCQMDSFRLVRYEMSTGKPSCGEENILLQQRHNAAPGMVLMYIRGKLLFVGDVFSGHSCSVKDLQKQISRTRADYRLGLSLPSDYKSSDTVNTAATDTHN